METNETRKGKYSKKILQEKKFTKMKKPPPAAATTHSRSTMIGWAIPIIVVIS
jgi:hypothetical protein